MALREGAKTTESPYVQYHYMKPKVVLITGGSSGIGKSIGGYLIAKDFIVYGSTRDLKKQAGQSKIELLELNVNDPTTIHKSVQFILEREGRLDVLVNNAGVGINGPLEEIPLKEITHAFDTNFNGPIRMIQAVLPQMRRQGEGLIINITSIAGHMGLPFRGVYSASKGALSLVTEALRIELQPFNIKVVNVAPGDFATNIIAGRYHVPLKKESPYAKAYGSIVQLINKDVNSGQDPVAVAKKVHRIITKGNPKIHYPVGAFLQIFSLFLKKILPSKIYEKMLKNHYKL